MLTAGLGVITTYLIPFLFVLTVIVFIHELGHFLVARWCGVKIDAFSIGFGPEIAGWVDKKGTRWKICALPLGGYVKFHGDASAASLPDREALEELKAGVAAEGVNPDEIFHFKPLWQRVAVVAAGPAANFLLAIIIYAVLFTSFGRMELLPVVGEVDPGSRAEAAGFKSGDLVTEVNGRAVRSFRDLQIFVTIKAETDLNVKVLRDGEEVMLVARPSRVEMNDGLGGTQSGGRLGISHPGTPETRAVVRYGPISAIPVALTETWRTVDTTLIFLGRIIVGKESAEQLGGPIRIAQMSGKVAEFGFYSLVGFMALLSVSIGLINLFPIPMLDGGHLLYYAFEAVLGRPLSERAQEVGFRIGLIFVLGVMIFATWNDISRLT